MAHIRERIGVAGHVTWQASIRRKGMTTVSKSFSYRADAEKWAAATEQTLTKLRKHDQVAMPPASGCYVIFNGDTCVYVGSSTKNVLKRVSEWTGLASHYIVVPCEASEVLAMEYRLIADYKPTRNVLGRFQAPRARLPFQPLTLESGQ